MLVLTRRVGETITIGGNVTVTVLMAKGDGRVRIGIEAPKSVAVHRGEVSEAIAREARKEGRTDDRV